MSIHIGLSSVIELQWWRIFWQIQLSIIRQSIAVIHRQTLFFSIYSHDHRIKPQQRAITIFESFILCFDCKCMNLLFCTVQRSHLLITSHMKNLEYSRWQNRVRECYKDVTVCQSFYTCIFRFPTKYTQRGFNRALHFILIH